MTDVAREESETGKYSTWVHIKNWAASFITHCKGSTDGGSTWVPLKVDADGKVIIVSG